jgi:quercetin dioxygenase-like cupin family protein
MSRRSLGFVVGVIAFGVIVAAVIPSAAQEPPEPIAAQILAPRAVFTDDVGLKIKLSTGGETHVVKTKDASGTVTARFTVQPGAQFPWHTHAGPVFVSVVEGTLVYVDGATCDHRTYPSGTAFVDLGHGDVHSAFNPGPGEAVIVATFFEVPASGELLIPADAPEGCVL